VISAAAIVACSAAGDLDLTSPPPASEGGPSAIPDGGAQIDNNDSGSTPDTGTTPPKGPADRCDGISIALTKEDASTLFKGKVNGTTAGLGNDYSASCGGGSGADAVYRIDPPLTGRATAKITSGFSAILSARTTCANDKAEIGCADDNGAGTTLSFPVFEGKPVFLFVDGYGGTAGEFSLDVDVQTAVCGNGKAEAPEECDDGNLTGSDGCSATCTLEDSQTTISACPGTGYRLKPGTVSFAGDTGTMANGGGSATGCASTGSGPNAIYAVTPTVTGNLNLSLLASFPGALLHVRRECSENATQADCSGATDELVPLTTSIPVFAEQTVFVFVDSSSTSNKGLYVLDATLSAAACGNGKRDGNEECDDNNTADGDGCSSACVVERDVATYTCPGKAVRLEGSARSLVVRGTTQPKAGESVPANKWATCGVSGAPDVVYAVTSDIDGWLTAKVKGSFNSAIAIRSTCPGTADLACSKAVGGNGEEVVSVAINKETPLYVVVDGQTTGQSGAFDLGLAVTASVCGNGVIEGGETCDDGAVGNGDGCDDHCQLEADRARDTCATAPAITLEPKTGGTYGTSFASGNTNLTTAVPNQHSLSPCSSFWADAWFPFTAPISGVVTARISSATFRSTIGVRTGCAPSGAQLTCDGTNAKGGQEIVFAATEGTTYYLAVAGGVVTSGKPEIGRFSVDVNLVPTGCGDTFFNPPEQCDDGNTANGDGCSSTCTVETLAGAQACPGHAVTLSGAGADVRRTTVTIDTTGLPSVTGSVCGGSGPEGVLVITPDIDGQLAIKATTNAGHAVLLHARTTCADATSEIKKSDCSAANLTSVNTTVKKNTPYYIFVDGQNAAAGVSKLQITVTP